MDESLMDFYADVEAELMLAHSNIDPDLGEVAQMQENGMSAFEVAQ